MSRNGAGVYSLPAPPSPFVNGQTASATDMMTVLTDIATALTGSLAADGQTPLTGNLNFAGYNATSIGAATAATVTTTGLITAGNGLTVTKGGLTVTAGGATITAGGLTVTAGGVTINAGGAAIIGNTAITGSLGTSGAIVVDAGGITIKNGGLTVSANGAAVTGNSTVTGTLTVSGVAAAANGTKSGEVVNYGQFPTTTGATGTETMPSGLIRKWGTGSTTAGSGAVAFAAAFATACDNVTLTINGGSGTSTVSPIFVGAVTSAGFDVWGKSTENLTFYWQAIGR